MFLGLAAKLGGILWQKFASLLRRHAVVRQNDICIVVIGLCPHRIDSHILVTEGHTIELINELQLNMWPISLIDIHLDFFILSLERSFKVVGELYDLYICEVIGVEGRGSH